MDLERLSATLLKLEGFVSSSDERFLETDARLTTQRFLLEQLYAMAYQRNPEDWQPFMDSLIDSTRAATTTPGPMANDDKVELQARVATHLDRFSKAVALRLDQAGR